MNQEKEPNKFEREDKQEGMMEQENPVVGEAREVSKEMQEKQEFEENVKNEWVDKVMAEADEKKEEGKTPEQAEDPRKELFRSRAKQLRLTRSVFNAGKIFDASPRSSEFASFVREQRRDKTLVNTVETMGAKEKFHTGVDQFQKVPSESQRLMLFNGDINEAFQVFEGRTATHPENVEKGLRELLRLVENGGELRIGPINTNIHEGPQKAMLGLLESALSKLQSEDEVKLQVGRREHDSQIPGGDGLEQGQFVLSIKKGGKAEKAAEAETGAEAVAPEANIDENGGEETNI